MNTNVTQVSRTYRTQALWFAAENAWKQAGKQFAQGTGSRSPKPPGTALSHSDEFDRYSRATAHSIASVLTTAGQLQQTAGKLLSRSGFASDSQDTEQFKREAQELVDRYNGLHTIIYDSIPPLKNGTAEPVLSNIGGLPLQELGIQQHGDGSMTLDPLVLDAKAAADFEGLQLRFRGPNGLAAALTDATEQLLTSPPEQLLDKKQGLFQAFTNYRFQTWGGGNPIRTYLPLPLTGILLNSYL